MNGVAVFCHGLPEGLAYVYPPNILETVEIAPLDSNGRLVDLAYERVDDLTGSLRIRFSLTPRWRDVVCTEIRIVQKARSGR